jgi:ribosome recycling factor
MRTLRISPWDKNVVKDIEKAIQASGLPLSVVVDGSGLRASVPQLTAESKQSLVKLCKEKLEDARVKVRMVRQTTDKDIEATEKAEDDKFRAKEELQKNVDEINKKLEELFTKKEADITTV